MLQILKMTWGLIALGLFAVLFAFAFNVYLGFIALPVVLAAGGYLVWIDMGVYLILLGKFDYAINYVTQRINTKGGNVRLYNMRGIAYYSNGDMYAALKDYQKALELDPKCVDAHNNLGTAYHKIGNYDAALTSYDTAIFLHPPNYNTYTNRSITLFKQQRYEEALDDCNQAIRIMPRYAFPYYLRGNTFFIQGDYPLALKNYQFALSLNGGLLRAKAGVAITMHAMGDLPKALNTWKAVIRKDAHYGDPVWLRKDLEWAEPLLREAQWLRAEVDR